MNNVRSNPSQWPFQTVLVANRGEIAVRVLRSVQKLGLKGAVVYHAPDRGTLAVKIAEVANGSTGRTTAASPTTWPPPPFDTPRCPKRSGYTAGVWPEPHGFGAAMVGCPAGGDRPGVLRDMLMAPSASLPGSGPREARR